MAQGGKHGMRRRRAVLSSVARLIISVSTYGREERSIILVRTW